MVVLSTVELLFSDKKNSESVWKTHSTLMFKIFCSNPKTATPTCSPTQIAESYHKCFDAAISPVIAAASSDFPRGSGATEESSTPAIQRQMGGEQYADKLSVRTEGSDRLLAKIKESLDLLISADTKELGSNHWLLVPLRNTKPVQALLAPSRQEVQK